MIQPKPEEYEVVVGVNDTQTDEPVPGPQGEEA